MELDRGIGTLYSELWLFIHYVGFPPPSFLDLLKENFVASTLIWRRISKARKRYHFQASLLASS